MVTLQEIEEQLKQIGASFRYWGRAEVLELRHVLVPGEQIKACMNGRWEGGFAMLCATDRRILLIDKKPMYLTIEDVRYDMVSEVDYSYRLLVSTTRICTPNQVLVFMGWNHSKSRTLTNYVQQRVMEVRQQHLFQQNLQTIQPLQSVPAIPSRQVATDGGVNFATFPTPTTVQLPYFQPMNPYTQSTLMTRRRFAGKFKR